MDEAQAKYISELEQSNLELQSELNNLTEAAIPYSEQIRQLQADNERLLSVVQKAYRKHHMNDTSIGWDELADDLAVTLCELMGDNQYQKWVKRMAALKGGE